MAKVGAPHPIFTPPELAAVAFRRTFDSAEAKTRLLELAGVIFPDPALSDPFVRATAGLIDRVEYAPDLEEVGNHLKALAGLLGPAATKQVVERAPQPDEPLADVLATKGAIAAPEDESVEAPDVSGQPEPATEVALSDPELANQNLPLTRPQKTMIRKVFGDEALERAKGLSTTEINSIFNEMCEAFVAIPPKRMTPQAQQERVSRLRAILIERLSFKAVAKRDNCNLASLQQAITNLTPEILCRELNPLQRAEVFERGISLAGQTSQDEPSLALDEAEHRTTAAAATAMPDNLEPRPTPENHRGPRTLEIPEKIEDALELLAQLTGHNSKEDFKELSKIFSTTATDVSRGEVIAQVRGDILALAELNQKDVLVPPELKLSDLEANVVKSITGNEETSTSPLSVNSTKAKYKKELQEAKVNIDKVLRTALAKIYTARSR